jgi:hypothetical protein
VDCLPATDWLPPLSPARLAYAHKHELQFDRSCAVLLLIPPRCSPRSLLLPLLLPLLLIAGCSCHCCAAAVWLGRSLFPRERAGASTTTPT